jgi:hypothetical protein
MDKIWNELANPAWWFSVVIAGLVINVLAAYAKSPIDSVLGRTTKRWATRTESLRIAREARIERLSHSARLQVFAIVHEMRIRFFSLTMLGLAILSLACILVLFALNSSPPALAVLALIAVHIFCAAFCCKWTLEATADTVEIGEAEQRRVARENVSLTASQSRSSGDGESS